MTALLILLLGTVFFGLLGPKSVHKKNAPIDWRSSISYGTLVLLLAASPIIGALVAGAAGLRISSSTAFSFSWIGVLFSLPIALMVAQLLGGSGRAGFWNYMQSSSRYRLSKRTIIVVWAVCSSAAFALGVAAFLFSLRAGSV